MESGQKKSQPSPKSKADRLKPLQSKKKIRKPVGA
jgi:hypothetical protein